MSSTQRKGISVFTFRTDLRNDQLILQYLDFKQIDIIAHVISDYSYFTIAVNQNRWLHIRSEMLNHNILVKKIKNVL